jgi:hypothetical protein
MMSRKLYSSKVSQAIKLSGTALFLTQILSFSFLFFLVVLGLELRAFTLSPLHQPFLQWVFSRYGFVNYLPGLALTAILLISAS